MARSTTKPVTAADAKLSYKHLKESVKFNKDHAKEHLKQAKEDYKLIKDREKARKKGF